MEPWVFCKSFHLLEAPFPLGGQGGTRVGVMHPWASIQPSLPIPTHHRNLIFSERDKS
jgi:hypothetical protein